MIEETAGYYAPDPRGVFERLLSRLFPERGFPDLPEKGFTLRTETVVRLDWRDRLRVLLTGWISVKVQTITDVEVRRAGSEATFSALRRLAPRPYLRTPLLLLALLAPGAFAQAPDTQAGASATVASRYSWYSETWSQSVAKQGKDRYVIFGARLAGRIDLGTCDAFSRLDASALPDGGGREGSVSFEDPASFQSLEGYVGVDCRVKGPLSGAAIVGMGLDIEGARVRTFEQSPVTIAGGIKLGRAGRYLYLLAGRHDAAGSGIKGLFALRVPVYGRSALIADGAVGGPLSFFRYGVSLSLKGSE